MARGRNVGKSFPNHPLLYVRRCGVAALGLLLGIAALAAPTAAEDNVVKATVTATVNDGYARVVFDMVYDPVETHLLQVARGKGIAVIPGVEMFVQQAARQFEIWTGKPAPAGDMLHAVTMALQERAAKS